MLAHAEEAIALLGERSTDELATDRLRFLAACRLVEIVGEAAAQIPYQVRDALPSIPLRLAAATRNRIIHGYGAVNAAILADTIRLDFPPLCARLREALGGNLPDEGKPT